MTEYEIERLRKKARNWLLLCVFFNAFLVIVNIINVYNAFYSDDEKSEVTK
jgi:hypothetical protein